MPRHIVSVQADRTEWMAFITAVKGQRTTAWAVLAPMIRVWTKTHPLPKPKVP